jgi:hypothetical protein
MNWLRSRVKPSDSATKKGSTLLQDGVGGASAWAFGISPPERHACFWITPRCTWPEALSHFDNARVGSKESREVENPQKFQKERENYCEECVPIRILERLYA